MLNEILGPAARFQQLLSRKFGILGGAPSPQLTPEITPEFSFGSQPEDSILQGEVRMSGVADVAANAGNRSAIQLTNPVNSGLVIVLEQIRVLSFVVGIIDCGFASLLGELATGPGSGENVAVDGRVQRGPTIYPRRGAGKTTKDTTTPGVIPGMNLFRTTLAANQWYEYQRAVIINSGGGVQLIGEVNKQFIAHFYWREVPIALGEVGPF
jgi:hypothetical protein